MATKEPTLAVVEDNRLIVRLTEEERGVLLALIDAAVKARGLEAAEAGHVLAVRIRDAKPPEVAG